MIDGVSKPVHCIFYTHPWALFRIGNERLGSSDDALLIELAESSTLSSLFDQQGRPRQGVTGLLADPDRIDLLGEVYEGVPAPLVLASQPAVPLPTLASAIGVLPYVRSRYSHYVLLANLVDGARMIDSLAHCDRFSFVFDLADPPSRRFTDLAEQLTGEGLLNASTWGGLYWYSHPRRRAPGHRERLQALRELTAGTQIMLEAPAGTEPEDAHP
ncbi:MAG: hypothetical protein AAGE01_08625 [Pseudomonadota bacterium]